jgi:ankyrin repeat protein
MAFSVLKQGIPSEALQGYIRLMSFHAVKNGEFRFLSLLFDEFPFIIEKSMRELPRNDNRETLLHIASRTCKQLCGSEPDTDYPSVIKMLIHKFGWHVDIRDCYNQSPLHHAAVAGTVEQVCMLVQEGAALDCIDVFGNTPLHLAAMFDNYEVAAQLIEFHADILITNRAAHTPLQLAAASRPSTQTHTQHFY